MAALDDIYTKAPKDATIILGEDINAKLGRNIWMENEGSTSPHPHHKITGPFSAHLHSNARACHHTDPIKAWKAMRTLKKGLSHHHSTCRMVCMCKPDGSKAVTDKGNAE
eukprot:13180554-Ditylum_brightwellii.AAC.1